MIVTAGKTNRSEYFYIVGNASNALPGEPVTGLLFSDIETGGSASYMRQGAARVDLTLKTLASALAAHDDGGFILVDDTNMPGVYRCDYPDAAYVTGVDEVTLQLVVASGKNAVASPIKVDITDFDLRTASVPQTADHTAAIAVIDGLVNELKEGLFLQVTTIATLASQTQFTLTDGSADNLAYHAAIIVVVDASASTQKAFQAVKTYTGGSKTIILTQDPGVFTMAVGDKVYIIPSTFFAIMDIALMGSTHNILNSFARRIRDLQEFGTYEGGCIFVDTVLGSSGTTNFESGTNLNPLDNMTDANTIAVALSLSRFCIGSGSDITLVAAQNTQDFLGNNWILRMGGQSLSSTGIEGAEVHGICTGALPPEFLNCHMQSITIPTCHIVNSDIEGLITLPAGVVDLHQCASENGAVLEFGVAVLNTTIHWTDFSGEVAINNLGQAGTDILNIRGHGKIVFNASCIGGTVNLDGQFTITNNGSGITFNRDENTVNILAIQVEANKIGLVDGGGGVAGSVIEEIQKRPDTAAFEVRTPTAAQLKYITDHAETAKPVTFTGGTTTTAVLGNVDGSAASAVNDFYNGRILIFNAGTLDEQATDITDYVGSTKTATITAVTTAVTSSHTAILV